MTVTYTVRGFVLAHGTEPYVLLRHASPFALDSELVTLASVLSCAHDVVWAPSGEYPARVWDDDQNAYGEHSETCTATPGTDRALVAVMRGEGILPPLQAHLDYLRYQSMPPATHHAAGSITRGNRSEGAGAVRRVTSEMARGGGHLPPPLELTQLAANAGRDHVEQREEELEHADVVEHLRWVSE